MKTIGDQQLLKRMNRSVLLRLLRAQPGLSRARLATVSTVRRRASGSARSSHMIWLSRPT